MNAESELFVVNAALQEAVAISGQMLGNVQLVDWRTGWLEIVAHRGFAADFLATFARVRSSDDCACGRALLQRSPVVVEDVDRDPRFPGLRAVARQAGFIAVQSTPLISSHGALLGIISTHGNGRPSDGQLGAIRMLAQRTADELVHLRANGHRRASAAEGPEDRA